MRNLDQIMGARRELWELLKASNGLTNGARALLVLLWVADDVVRRRDAAARLGVTVSTVDRHVVELHHAGLVDRTAQGTQLRKGTS